MDKYQKKRKETNIYLYIYIDIYIFNKPILKLYDNDEYGTLKVNAVVRIIGHLCAKSAITYRTA